MKRFLTILMVGLLVFSVTAALAADYSSLTDEELKAQYDGIRNELLVRGLKAEKKTVILEENGVQIYISGGPEITKTWTDKLYLNIPVVIVNDSDKSITVTIQDASVNGWTTDTSFSNNDVPAGKKSKGTIKFELAETDVEAVEDFEDFELRFTVYDADNWFGTKVVDKVDAVTVYASDVN